MLDLDLKFKIHVNGSNNVFTATMDIPQQGLSGYQLPAFTYKKSKVHFELPGQAGMAKFDGILKGDSIIGSVLQAGVKGSFSLHRISESEIAKQEINKPDEPLPYSEEEVAFKSGRILLAGTLTTPQGSGPFPAVILLTGIGPQNRDEEILGHKPFLVIADYLAQRGIASLRWDDRGVAGSTGTFQTATTLDFADDAQAAIDFLAAQPGINDKELGVIGHSEGGLIAAILGARSATRTQVPKLAFLVMLAGPGVRGDQLLLMQNAALGRASGMTEAQIEAANAVNNELYSIAMSQGDPAALHAQIVNALNLAIDKASGLSQAQKEAQRAQVSVEADQLLTPWMRTFLALDPAEYLKQVTVPVLALDGTKDLQVPATENLAAIAKALKSGGDSAVTTVDFEGLNHLFQHATTGLPSEYGTIKEDFAPEALEAMGDWILKVANK